MRQAWTLTLGVLLCALLSVGPAQAHKNYCGHTSVTWSVWSYGQQIVYFEVFDHSYNSGGIHWHVTDVTSKQAGTLNLRYIHSHTRACGSTPAA